MRQMRLAKDPQRLLGMMQEADTILLHLRKDIGGQHKMHLDNVKGVEAQCGQWRRP